MPIKLKIHVEIKFEKHDKVKKIKFKVNPVFL